MLKMHNKVKILCIFIYNHKKLCYSLGKRWWYIMEPFMAQKLPIGYNIDKDLLSLISEASKKYGEYKSNLKNSKFDSKFFLDSIILSESLKSTQIEGTQISQDEMYYLKYMPKTDETSEIQNLKKVIEYSKDFLHNNKKLDIKKNK